jgi:tripartite-type tricarboxylate transporter receptor subunit TctC
MNIRRKLLSAAIAGAFVLAALPAGAAPLSQQSVKIVVGFAAGGAVDAVARILASRLNEKLEGTVIVDNKPGFSGNLGAQFVAKAPADGTTLLMAPVTSYAVTEAMMGRATGFSIENDFVPIGVVGEVPLLLVVHPSVKANTVAEFIALAKSEPGKVSFASSGNGSTEHVAAELFQQKSGVSLLHVPYKGGSPAVADVMGGQVQSMFATIPNVIANVKGNRMKALAIMTPSRHPALPQVPTAAESGLSGVDVSSVYVLMAPVSTPAPIVQRLNADLSAILKEPATIEKIAALGITPGKSTLAEAKTQTQAEVARWRDVVKSRNIKAD